MSPDARARAASTTLRGSALGPAPVFAAGERVALERGERSKRAALTGATGVVVDGAAARGWLRVRVGDATLRWHQRDLRRVPPVESLKGDVLALVLELVDCRRSLVAASRVCRDWRVACRQPSVWHTVDFAEFDNKLGYALHLIDVRARLRVLRIDYAVQPADARVLCWLLRECDTSALERARVATNTASPGVISLFACEVTEDIGDGVAMRVCTGGSLAHLESLLALPSLSAERRARVAALLADHRAVVAARLRAPSELHVLAAQAPALRVLDLGSVRPDRGLCARGIAAMHNLESLRVLVKTHATGQARKASKGHADGAFVRELFEHVIPKLPKLRQLELGGFDPDFAVTVRSRSLEVLDVRALTKTVFLAEARCPRLRQLIYTRSGYYTSGVVPYILATDLASRQTVRLSMYDCRDHHIEPDGYGFHADDCFRLCNPAYSHLQHARVVTALWELADDYDGSGHAKAAAYGRFMRGRPHWLALQLEQAFPIFGLEDEMGSFPSRLTVLDRP